jgi:hypothetical protein
MAGTENYVRCMPLVVGSSQVKVVRRPATVLSLSSGLLDIVATKVGVFLV